MGASTICLTPWVRVAGVAFSSPRAVVLSGRGETLREARSGIGLHAWDFGDIVFRFQDSGRLEEVTCHAAALDIDGVVIPVAALAAFVRAQDVQAFDRAGFLVSPRYGIAFDPAAPRWITALAPHCLPQWRALPG